MRRVTALALIAGGTLAVVAGGAFLRTRLRGGKPGIPKPVTGMFSNGMAYARWGAGPKTLLLIPGGPGNAVPGGVFLSWFLQAVRPLVEDGYTAWVVTRKQNMPKGYSIADMADDYGQVIADEFDGKADLVLGESTGGQIGFYLAARHPDRFGHIAIAVAGYEESEQGKGIALTYARLLSEGRTGEAMASMFNGMNPSWPRGVDRVLGAVMGRLMFGETHPYFASDVMVEAEAEVACDAREVLPDIPVPVLLVCGDQDPGFSKEVYEETARLIPDCTLRMYEGIGHVGASRDKRFPQDVLDFVRQRPRVEPEPGEGQSAIVDQPSAPAERPARPTSSPVGSVAS